ncbi:MAG: hypothetical protein WDO12_05120 [Pseudomonadota bacterium]
MADLQQLRAPVNIAATVVLLAFSLSLIALPFVALAKPAIVVRFLGAFATSARTHYAEQLVRLLVGTALIVRAPSMWVPGTFRLIGWLIAISSVLLLCLPWQWHHRLGERMRPLFFRYLWLYIAGAFAFGVLLIYGVIAGGEVAWQIVATILAVLK